MIIYNTTFHVEKEIEGKLVDYLKEVYIPTATRKGELTSPRLAKVLTTQKEQEGECFSLQFSAKDMEVFDTWFEKQGEVLLRTLYTHFQNKVLYFSTFLEEITLE